MAQTNEGISCPKVTQQGRPKWSEWPSHGPLQILVCHFALEIYIRFNCALLQFPVPALR